MTGNFFNACYSLVLLLCISVAFSLPTAETTKEVRSHLHAKAAREATKLPPAAVVRRKRMGSDETQQTPIVGVAAIPNAVIITELLKGLKLTETSLNPSGGGRLPEAFPKTSMSSILELERRMLHKSVNGSVRLTEKIDGQVVSDVLAASTVEAARAEEDAKVALRAQRTTSALLSFTSVIVICIILLYMPRLLDAFWNHCNFGHKSTLGLDDVEAKPEKRESAEEDEDEEETVDYSASCVPKMRTTPVKVVEEEPKSQAAAAELIGSLARSSKIPAARRVLQKADALGWDAKAFLKSEEVERLMRMSSLYESSIPELQAQVSTYQTSEKLTSLKLEWGISLERGMMKVMSVQDMPGVDIMKCVGAHMEKALAPLYDKDTLSCESCGERSVNDAVWRTIMHTQSTGSKSDLVNYASVIDALDEPLGSIWLAYYVTPEFTPQNSDIPPPLAGHFRATQSVYVIRFQPLKKGVRMTSFLETGVSKAVYSLLTLMPSFALKRLVRGMVETAAESLANFCRVSSKIEEAMKTSPSAELYERLQRHLEDKK